MSSAHEYTHTELCTVAARWLARRSRIAVAEPPLQNTLELPDALGWTSAGTTLLVEVKVSRADFLADRQKVARRVASMGMGDQRWYMTPKGMLGDGEIPSGWGLLEVYGTTRRVRQRVKPTISVRSPGAMRYDLRALTYVAQRIQRFGDLDPESLRFRPIVSRGPEAAE